MKSTSSSPPPPPAPSDRPSVPSIDESLASRGLDGVKGDLARRLACYGSDWKDGLHPKVLAATGFLFFACIAPAIAFGGLMSVMTGGSIGVVEMIVATAVCGVAYAIISGQPLTILGGTGPLLVFTGILYDGCQRLGLPFLPTYGWVGLWTGFFVIVLGLTGASRFVSRLTRFTDETFAALISIIFIYQAVANIAHAFPASHIPDDSALFGLVLAVGTYMAAQTFTRMRNRPYLRRPIRELLADFGPALAVLIMVYVRTLLPTVEILPLNVPTTFSTTSGRPWLVALGETPTWAILASAIPAMLVAVLFFLDQNVTVRIVQSRENKLKKGGAYHWDLVVTGLLVTGCSFVGLPWLVAATVRSVNHVRALSKMDGATVTGVIENRVSPFAVHLLIGLALAVTSLLRAIPMPVLYGLFLYMGVTSLRGNQFFDRLRLWLTDPKLVPPHHYVRRVPARIIHTYTAVQAVSLALLWIVKSSALGILFPLFIALLVPVRSILGRYMTKEHLAALDAEEIPSDVQDEFAGP